MEVNYLDLVGEGYMGSSMWPAIPGFGLSTSWCVFLQGGVGVTLEGFVEKMFENEVRDVS